MRSAFIVCSLAATLLAVPVPLPNDVAIARRESAGPVGTLMDKIYVREAGAVNRLKNARDAEPEAEPGLRHADRRADQPDNALPRRQSAEPIDPMVNNIHLRDVNKLDSREPCVRVNYREAGVATTYSCNREAGADPGNRSNTWGTRRKAEAGTFRSGSPREAKADPGNRSNTWGTRREAEAGTFRSGSPREAKADLGLRHADRRNAEPEADPGNRSNTWGTRREAEAEPMVRTGERSPDSGDREGEHGYVRREAEAEAEALPGFRSSSPREAKADPGLRHADRRNAEPDADPGNRSNSWGRREAEADPQDRPNWVRTAEPAKINQREADAEADPQDRPNWVRTAEPAKINQREADAEAEAEPQNRLNHGREAEPVKVDQREA